MNLSESKTLQNLMRAFAGECQAHMRYYFAAGHSKNEKLPVIQRIFTYTADQESEHAGIFYKHMRGAGLRNVDICAGYPVDLKTDVLSLLQDARYNENEEHRIVYPDFAQTARDEGFPEIAASFSNIAKIEQTHGERFEQLAKWIEGGTLFSGNKDERWVCLNCGNVIESAAAPEMCPVCRHEQGYYIREAYAPYARSMY